jgi:hypothetical protein
MPWDIGRYFMAKSSPNLSQPQSKPFGENNSMEAGHLSAMHAALC